MKLKHASLDELQKLGVAIFETKTFHDNRGSLDLFYEGLFAEKKNPLTLKIAESSAGVARGLHWQTEPFPLIKLITVLSGDIYDFLYDPCDAGTIFVFRLRASDNLTVQIPAKFAHGYIALTETRFMYCCSGIYSEENERTFNFLPAAAKLLNLSAVLQSEKDASIDAVTIELSGS